MTETPTAESVLRRRHLLPLTGGAASVVGALVHLGAIAACWPAWGIATSGGAWSPAGWAGLAVLWALIVWMDHAALTRLHEAGHAMLSRVRWFNELQGIIIGTASLIPMSVYRYVHARHHAHLGRPRDPEFWPYNLPGTPRWIRLAYAWTELLAGWIATPALYSFRTLKTWRHVPRGQRRRIMLEWLIIAAVWGGTSLAASVLGFWTPLLVCFLVPAYLAGSFQTIRKFTEHLGMHGEDIEAMTRMVVYQRAAGRAASRSQLHVDHHATHHRHAKIPFYHLPEATAEVYAQGSEGTTPGPVFGSHAAAILDMLPHLLDPKLGPQWAQHR